METQGRTFLVTGGGSGLGAAVVKNLVEDGANVIIADLEGEETDGNVRFVDTDVTDEQSVQAAVDATLEFEGLH
ncbi:MAG: SDR family NAD(P)-dependent oxidoreductase, partial [Actinobacteria bacterium]|nr:SDR family NAD(P)-dependent oxidoreductase [Actinomycetota bacterium]